MMKISLKLLALFLLLLVNLSCTAKKLDTSLQLVLQENPKSLDPIGGSDALAAEAMGPTYETLLQYHYLKRPYTLVPLLAERMPEYSKDGLTVTVHIKKNIRFQDDPCFAGGKGRELRSSDFVYAFKRLVNPKNQSDSNWIFEGKISEYQTPDPYTLIFKLKKKYPQLNNVLALVPTAPMPHEAIEKYGPEIVNHAVGTGAFFISDYTRSSQIVYEKNKNYHGENFPEPEQGYSNLDFGKALPLTERIVTHIIMESQPVWLNFVSGHLDLIRLSKDNFDNAISAKGNLNQTLTKKGISLSKNSSTTEWYLGFNMDDPLLGKNKYLRKAIGLAYDSQKDIELFTRGLGALSNQILPPQIEGFNKSLPARESNVEKAKAALVKAGYPGGKGLPAIAFDIEGSSTQRQAGEYFKNQMAQIGINITIVSNTRPQLFDKRKKGKLQIQMDGWIADYPDAENFMQLLYGPNKPPGPNNEAFSNPAFDRLYEQMATMAPSRERQKIINKMTAIFLEESPWIPNWRATLYYFNQGWLKNYIYSDFSYNNYKYYRLDQGLKRQLLKNF